MGERRGSLRPGREAAAMAGDTVMSVLDHLVARLHEDAVSEDAEPAARATAVPHATVVDLVGALVAALVPAVLRHLDPDELLDRVDVNALVARIDVEAVVERVDVDALVARVDVNAVVDRLDIDAIVRRIDLEAVTREALDAVDIGDIVRESTATIGSDVVEGTRSQSMRADALLARGIDRLLRRDGPRRTALPARRGAS